MKSYRRLIVTLVFAASLSMLASTAAVDAHITTNYGGDHDWGKDFAGSKIIIGSKDTIVDGHCTYQKVNHNHGMVVFEDARSCNRWVYKRKVVGNIDAFTVYYRCITGHWRCERYKEMRSVGPN